MLLLLSLAMILLLALNAFFVLAEFAIVKVRPTRITELVASGDPRATVLEEVHGQLDNYLSVCQIGITLASVALGMVGQELAEVAQGQGEPSMLRTALAVTISYVVVSGSHIVLGELIPKSIAIRIADRAALRCAAPLRRFRKLFLPAIWLFDRVANLVLRAFGFTATSDEENHSEDELRIILNHSQERGLLSFRRLLFIENVFDLGELTVRDAMRPRSQIRCFDSSRSLSENLEVARSSRFTRYPVLAANSERPVGFIHLKDLLLVRDGVAIDIATLVRPLLSVPESMPLEQLLAEMQRRRVHVAVTNNDAGAWTGLVTFEDVIEELVGTIRDEFEDEDSVRLGDVLAADRIHLDVEGRTTMDAVRAGFARTAPAILPLPAEELLRAIDQREKQVGTYLGQGIVMPHARIAGLAKPFLMILRSRAGVRCGGTQERGHLLFVLLTPAGQPRIHQRLQSSIAILLNESAYVSERLLGAETPAEVLEAIRTGEQAALA